MLAPNIGLKLLKRFRTDPKEPLLIRRHLGYVPSRGTDESLGYDEEVLAAPHAFVPVPPNMQIDPLPLGDELRDARWLWAAVPLSRGVDGDPPEARAPDQIVRVNTGEVYRVWQVTDVGSLQDGLCGALLLRLKT
jgi:hypothetical protein